MTALSMELQKKYTHSQLAKTSILQNLNGIQNQKKSFCALGNQNCNYYIKITCRRNKQINMQMQILYVQPLFVTLLFLSVGGGVGGRMLWFCFESILLHGLHGITWANGPTTFAQVCILAGAVLSTMS
jgi:hypothetical protein